MSKRVVFRAVSPLGYTVVLTRDRWREIVRFKHPAVAGFERDAERCVSGPDSVRASKKDPDVHLHYVKVADHQHLCIVVAPSHGDERFVVTAYFTERVKEGEELWRR